MSILQFITHSNNQYNYIEGAELALKGGCKWIQLRAKDTSDAQIVEIGLQFRKLCDQYNAKLIINDKVHLVNDIKADGVHLGKNDMPIAEAKKILSLHKIIGGTANTFNDIINLFNQGANYIGCGPYQYTETKKELAEVIGLNGYKKIIRLMSKNHIKIPLIAIGGIKFEDAKKLLSIGIDGIAVSSAILDSPNPREATEQFMKLINKQNNHDKRF